MGYERRNIVKEEIDWLKEMAEERMEELRRSMKQIREDPTTKWDFPRGISRKIEVIAIKELIADRDFEEGFKRTGSVATQKTGM